MNTKLFRKYVRNYLGVLALLLLLLIPLYTAMYRGTKELIVKETLNKLEQGIINLENRISKMRVITNLLCDDKAVGKIARIKGEPAP